MNGGRALPASLPANSPVVSWRATELNAISSGPKPNGVAVVGFGRM